MLLAYLGLKNFTVFLKNISYITMKLLNPPIMR